MKYDQNDTVYDLMAEGKTFEEALRTREFEPDDPNYTPRISGIINVEDGRYDFAMSILKSDDGDPDYCIRNTFTYPGCPAGKARFIHTYMEDANPLPSFETLSGKASTRITKYLSLYGTSISQREHMRLVSSTRINRTL